MYIPRKEMYAERSLLFMETILRTEQLCKYYGTGDNQVQAVRDAEIAIQK